MFPAKLSRSSSLNCLAWIGCSLMLAQTPLSGASEANGRRPAPGHSPTSPTLAAITILIPDLVEQSRANTLPMQVRSAKLLTRVHGILAETEVELEVFNPNRRPLEGELVFPLPMNASLQGFALDIDGQFREGVPVPAPQARLAFEAESRKAADPGLLEASRSDGANTFRTRIQPIPPKASRRVMLRYTALLDRDPSGQAIYRAPMNFPAPLAKFSWRVEVINGDSPPVIPQAASLSNIAFANRENVFIAEKSLSNIDLPDELLVVLPDHDPAARKVKPRIRLERHEGETFAVAALEIPLPPPDCTNTFTCPGKVRVIHDVSRSTLNADRELLREFLSDFLASRPEGVELEWIELRHQPSPPESVQLSSPAQIQDFLSRKLDNPACDGASVDLASALASISAQRQPSPGSPPVLTLIAADAMATMPGPDAPASPAAPSPGSNTFILQLQTTVNLPVLETLGHVLDLRTLMPDTSPESCQRVRKAMATCQLSFPVTASGPRHTSLNSRLAIPGKTLVAAWKIDPSNPNQPLTLSTPDGNIVLDPTSLPISPGRLARSLYAQNRLQALLSRPDSPERKAAITALGKEFGIVTPGTSLLVLESLDQYLEYAVRPPQSLARMRREYDANIARETRETKIRQELAAKERVASIDRQWQHLVSWYEGKIPADPTGGGGSLLGGLVDLLTGEPQYQAPPMPAPVAPSMADSMDNTQTATIQVKPWNSRAPYLARLANAVDPEQAYLELAKTEGSPAFFLDCAQWFFEKSGKASSTKTAGKLRQTAIRILSNLLELDWGTSRIQRTVAYKLRHMGEFKLASQVLAQVARDFPEELQSWRDLALVLEDLGNYQGAFDTLMEGLRAPLDPRFSGVEQILLVEINRLLVIAKAKGKAINTRGLDPRFIYPMPVALRVVINWDTNDTDMDLWVTDPAGDTCKYSRKNISSGGQISRDVTGGFGPEQFMSRKALNGNYRIETDYYGANTGRMLAPVTLYAEIFTHYGSPREQRQSLVFRLSEAKEVLHIGDARFDPNSFQPATRPYQVRPGQSRQDLAARHFGSGKNGLILLNQLNPGLATREPDPYEIIILPEQKPVATPTPGSHRFPLPR